MTLDLVQCEASLSASSLERMCNLHSNEASRDEGILMKMRFAIIMLTELFVSSRDTRKLDAQINKMLGFPFIAH
jgi:hypothetical protein